MDIKTFTEFFKWCTIINGALLIFSVLMFTAVPDLVYGVQSALFPLARETFDVLIYAFLGLYKIIFFIFNVVPFAALLIVAKRRSPSTD